MLTVRDVAERLHVDPDTVRTLITSGALRAMKVSGARNSHYRIREEWLADYEARAQIIPPVPAAAP